MPLLTPRKGFTLLEVLVALAVVAIALGAAVQLSASLIDTSYALRQRTLARWVAQNHLNLMLARNQFPAIGSRDGEEQMAGRTFRWREDVSNTPNQYYRRVELRVFDETDADFALASLIAYVHESQN